MARLLIEVPDALSELARQRGATPEDLIGQAVLEWLARQDEDAEDEHIARERWARIRSGEARTLSHEEVWRELDALPD